MNNGEDAQNRADAGEPLDDTQEMYRKYRADILQARSQVAARNVSLIQKAANGGEILSETTRTYTDDSGKQVTEREVKYSRTDWRAARYLLEVSFKQEYGRIRQLEAQVTGAGGGPLQIEDASVSRLAEQLERVREQMLADQERMRADVDAAEARELEQGTTVRIIEGDVVGDIMAGGG